MLTALPHCMHHSLYSLPIGSGVQSNFMEMFESGRPSLPVLMVELTNEGGQLKAADKESALNKLRAAAGDKVKVRFFDPATVQKR